MSPTLFMKRYIRNFLFLLFSVCAFTACEENINTDEEFSNWKERNDEAFKKLLNQAHSAIAQAKTEYGDRWESHCEWRAFRTYAQAPDSKSTATDSICVKIVENGKGSGCPLYTDSVSVNYLGRLLPSESYPEGFVFDHSSKGSPVADVFNPQFAVPTMFLVSNNIEGFTTALQKMHIGDHWLIYIPSELGYGTVNNNVIPGSSMLTFEVQLMAYYRSGFSPNIPNK